MTSLETNCQKCGKSISKFSLVCPFCLEHSDRKIKQGSSFETEISNKIPRGQNVVIINRKSLNGIVRSAAEILPYETIGFLFGERIRNGVEIKEFHSMQNVKERNIHSVIWDLLAEQRVKDVAKAFGKHIYIGSYHSHPYQDPEIINNKMLMGISLSQADINCMLKRRCDVEIVIGIFPWESWRLRPISSSWKDDDYYLTCDQNVKIGNSHGCKIIVASYEIWTGKIQEAKLSLSNY